MSAENENADTNGEDENDENNVGGISTQIDSSEFCYLLSSCSKRVIDNIQCTLGRNNFLDVRFFVPNVEECQSFCQETPGCRYTYTSKLIYTPLCLKLLKNN